ncbi:hypothetical protein Dsin_014794 [Dipteronia sinensis]|uniref:Prolamin-like domain-containing protein n=1 Tax=Dipteronia sinensis TaxID=43782 RepID=A0AAE0EAC7_9ROSI|nr:hypothetical protein Dsin_014794 [Dipteronia sinensis]
MNPQTQLVSYLVVFFDDTYVSAEVFSNLDLPPVFDEDESDDESGICENVVSGGFNSQGLASFHHRLGMMNHRIRGQIPSRLERITNISLRQKECTTKLQTWWGNQLVASLFGAGTVSPACCHNLATFGRPCYDEFLVVSLPYHKEIDTTEVIAKNEKVWNDCATVKPSA